MVDKEWFVSFVGLNHLTNTQNNWSCQSSKINTRHYAMNIKMSPFSNKKMFNMLQFNVGGVHLGLLVKMQFMGLVIGWVSCMFVWNNGESSWYVLLNLYIMQFVIWCHPFKFFVKVQNGGGCKHPLIYNLSKTIHNIWLQ